MKDELLYEVGIGLLPGIGIARTRQLISYCGSAKAVFETPKGKLLKIPGIGEAQLDKFAPAEALRKAELTLKQAEQHQTRLLFYTHPDFPKRLKQIPDAPTLLFYKGNTDLNHSKIISIVGSRKATEYGRQVTERIVQDLKKHNALILSGLAYGIDIFAHRAALQQQLPTVGVMASGIDIVYPPAHKRVAEQMQEQGGLLTEHFFGTEPHPRFFPARNRIIAGLSDCTIIVEAAVKGGAMVTADIAHGYNKDIMAVPGNITSDASGGCNYLIQAKKAEAYTKIEDLETLLNWDGQLQLNLNAPLFNPYNPENFSEEEMALIEVLAQAKEELIDDLSWKTQIPVSRVASLLLGLEFRSVVKALPGKRFMLVR